MSQTNPIQSNQKEKAVRKGGFLFLPSWDNGGAFISKNQKQQKHSEKSDRNHNILILYLIICLEEDIKIIRFVSFFNLY